MACFCSERCSWQQRRLDGVTSLTQRPGTSAKAYGMPILFIYESFHQICALQNKVLKDIRRFFPLCRLSRLCSSAADSILGGSAARRTCQTKTCSRSGDRACWPCVSPFSQCRSVQDLIAGSIPFLKWNSGPAPLIGKALPLLCFESRYTPIMRQSPSLCTSEFV